MKLALNALSKALLGLLLFGAMLFLPAWTLSYPGAWLLIALLFVPMLILGTVLAVKAPALLKKRLDYKEKQATQKGVIAFSGLLFLACFVLSALDFRFGWSQMPHWVVIAASAVLLISYGLYAEVMRENAYLSRTIEVQDGQKVVDTGLYGIVRHPMYAVTVWMFLSIPLVLGSWWALLCFAHYPVLMVIRIHNEEKVLEQGLEGYSDYRKRVKYRLLPFVW